MSIEQDKILAYLDNQLNDVERAKMEDALSKDPALVSQLAAYKEMNGFLSVQQDKEQAFSNLEEVHAEMISSVKSDPDVSPPSQTQKTSTQETSTEETSTQEKGQEEKTARSMKSILKLLALIIGAIAFFYVGYQILNKGIGQVKASEAPELLYAANFDPADISFTARGVSSDVTLLGRAAKAFNAKDYVVAIDMFERGIGLGAMNPRAYYAYCIALIAEGQTDKARLILEDLSDKNPIYKDDALWYIALSHLAEGQKQGDNIAARSALAGISKNSKWYKQAFLLLGELGE